MNIDYPTWLDKDVWKEFVSMRKTIRKPLTPYGEKLAIKRLGGLREAGEDPTAVVEQSIMMCYQGLFPVIKDNIKQQVDWEALGRE